MNADDISEFHHAIFDLDDTILDTSGVLIPLATKEAAQAMAEAGLELDPEQAPRIRSEILREIPRALVFKEFAERFTPHVSSRSGTLKERRHELERIGLTAFLNPSLASLTELRSEAFVEGARELLDYLGQAASLHLVTAGVESVQRGKIAALEIVELFASVTVVAPERGAKFLAYQNLSRNFADPGRVLVVGNRVDTDLAPGKRLGFRTAWIRHGEHRTVEPQSQDEIPDFEVRTPLDLLTILKQRGRG